MVALGYAITDALAGSNKLDKNGLVVIARHLEVLVCHIPVPGRQPYC